MKKSVFKINTKGHMEKGEHIKKVDDDYQYVKGQYSMPKQEEVEVVMN